MRLAADDLGGAALVGVEVDGAHLRVVDAGEAVEKARLAGSVRADDGEQFTPGLVDVTSTRLFTPPKLNETFTTSTMMSPVTVAAVESTVVVTRSRSRIRSSRRPCRRRARRDRSRAFVFVTDDPLGAEDHHDHKDRAR